MRLLIETTRGWKLTLSTPSHAAVEKTARPGTWSFATKESKSTPVAENPYSKFSRRSLGAYDINEEICAEPRSSQTPSRSGSIRKTFRWFRFHFSRTAHFDSNCPAYNEDLDTLPPYHHQHSSELHSLTVQELPGETPEMAGQEMLHELGAFDIGSYEMNTAGYLNPSFHLDRSDEWSQAGMACPYRRVPTPLQIPCDPTSMITESQAQTVPAMIMGGSPTNSSPVSLNTPGANSNYDVQNPYGVGFVGDSMSPYEAPSSGAGPYAADGHDYYGTQEYSLFSVTSHPGDVGPIEMPDSSPMPRPHSHPLNNYPSGSNESYHQTGQEMIILQPSVTKPRSPYRASEDPRIGTFEFEGSKWCRQPKHMGRVEDYSLQDQQVLNQPQQAVGHVDNDRPQSLSQEGSTTATQAKSYSPVACEECGIQFKGRYGKGNKKRHFNRFHNLFRSKAGMTCRECRKEFNRGDAARKHERTVHGLADVMTTSRRRGKAPAAV